MPVPSGGHWQALAPIVIALLLVGFGIGFGWPHLLTRILQVAPEADKDIAGASITTVQLFATAFGAALAGMTANLAGLNDPGGAVGAASAARWLFLAFALAPLLAVFSAALRGDRAAGRRDGQFCTNPALARVLEWRSFSGGRQDEGGRRSAQSILNRPISCTSTISAGWKCCRPPTAAKPSRHSHEGFCVGVIDDGAQRFYRTGGEHVAPLGSIILVNADDIHTGSSATEEGWSYQAMYPTPELLAFLSRDLKTGAGATPYFPNPVVRRRPGRPAADGVQLLRSDENRLMKETMVFSALTWLMLRHGKSRIDPTPQSRAPGGAG